MIASLDFDWILVAPPCGPDLFALRSRCIAFKPVCEDDEDEGEEEEKDPDEEDDDLGDFVETTVEPIETVDDFDEDDFDDDFDDDFEEEWEDDEDGEGSGSELEEKEKLDED